MTKIVKITNITQMTKRICSDLLQNIRKSFLLATILLEGCLQCRSSQSSVTWNV